MRMQAAAVPSIAVSAWIGLTLSLNLGRLEWLMATGERPVPSARRAAVVVLGYSLEWPAGVPVRQTTILTPFHNERSRPQPHPLMHSDRTARAKDQRRAGSRRASQGFAGLQRRLSCRQHDQRGIGDACTCSAVPCTPARFVATTAHPGDYIDVNERKRGGRAAPTKARSSSNPRAARRHE